jgi:hypothetical protein
MLECMGKTVAMRSKHHLAYIPPAQQKVSAAVLGNIGVVASG